MEPADRLRFLEIALASSSDGVVIVDARGQLVFANDVGKELVARLQSGSSSAAGRSAEMRYPDGRPVPAEEARVLERALRGESVAGLELRLRQPHEVEAFLSVVANPIHGEQGDVIGAVATARDITDRRRAEATLRASEAKYRGLWKAVEAGIVVYDAEGRVVETNEKAMEMLGPIPESGHDWAQIGPSWPTFEESGAPLPREMHPGLVALRTGKRVDEVVIGVVRPSEEERWLLVNAVPTRDAASGAVLGAVATFVDFTAHKRTEDELLRLTVELQAVFRSIPDVLFRLDSEATILDYMAGEPADHPIAPEAFLGRRVRDVVPVAVGRQVEEAAARVIGSGVPEAIEYSLPLPRGEQIFEARLFSMPQRQALVIVRNVTERRRAEEERERLLKEVDLHYRRFRAVFDNAPAGIVVLRGPEFVAELINSVVADWEGNTAAEISGKPLAEAWPLVMPQIQPVLESVLRTGQPRSLTDAPIWVRRSLTGPAEQRYFTFTAVPLRLRDEPPATLLLFVDTTDYVMDRQSIERLAEVAERQAAQLRGILEHMVDGVFACDATGRVTLVNEAGARLFGLTDVQEVGRLLTESPEQLQFRHLDGAAYARDELPLARARAGEVVRREHLIVRNLASGRDVYVRGSAAPVCDGEGKVVGAVSVLWDVTELTELDRLKDQFIQVSAHELKTPVTIMKGYAQALLRSDQIPPSQRKMLRTIDHGADRIERIINDLLDISKLQTGRLELAVEPIDLRQLVEGVADRMALTTSKHRITLVKAQPAVVKGDRDRLEQVLAHLIGNAIRFSPSGGDVEVVVDARNGEAYVSVRDQGVGIPLEKQGRIFERFYRAHTNTPYDYGGMGVGLHISREIITRHGGRMWFESEEGRGSEFSFALPLG